MIDDGISVIDTRMPFAYYTTRRRRAFDAMIAMIQPPGLRHRFTHARFTMACAWRVPRRSDTTGLHAVT